MFHLNFQDCSAALSSGVLLQQHPQMFLLTWGAVLCCAVLCCAVQVGPGPVRSQEEAADC
jgi:hypothetical protein